MRYSLILLSVLVWSQAPAVDPQTKSPDLVILACADALLKNDLVQFFNALPIPQQKEMTASWDQSRRDNTEEGRMQKQVLDMALTEVYAKDALENLVREHGPGLEVLNSHEISQGIIEITQLVGNGMQQAEDSALILKEMGKHIQQLGSDVGRWVATEAQLLELAKLRKSFSIYIESVKKTGITSSKDLETLTLPEFLKKLNPLVVGGKSIWSLYGLNADAFLRSVKATRQGNDRECTLTIQFTAFNSPYTFNIPLVKDENGEWVTPESFTDPLINLLNVMNVPDESFEIK
jgi:hypothetical protein